MKYSELISFSPIESTIQLRESNNSKESSATLVKTYVMSDAMAENLQAPVIDQLQMDEVVDNKGVLIIGNYGTGKSHLMSVISSIAFDADNVQYLQNRRFASEIQKIAGKFEVLRIEIGGVTMSLREILFEFIKEDFDNRGIDFEIPDFAQVKDNKELIKSMMAAFATKYADKGYLIVVDEFLSYLSSRNEREIVLDLEFFRALGEMCSKSKLRVMFGVQEKIFDNPKFSFVSNTLMHVRDRFTQISIKGEDTAYVVSERILKKSPEQKAMIRAHLEKFCNLYGGMSSRLDEFVDLYPIHPSYIDVFNKLYLIENRHVLKNISTVIKSIFDQQVPDNEPGVYSFDSYWPDIKSNGLLKTDPTISKVVNASGQLEAIIRSAFPKAAYKPLAIKIIYALSVHRLQNNDLSLKFGMTAENLKDDLCLYLPMPEQDSDFLLGAINATLREIIKTVSGQFIVYNESNNQYYIDVDQVVNYDEKISQKASILADDELNRYFYQIVYSCLEWEQKQYVSGFNIYEHDLNWASHNIFREGYLFMGLPGERSTAQPERDFYIHIMPPYGNAAVEVKNLDDEVYFYFKSSDDFKETLALYAAANALADISEGKDKEAYLGKANITRRKLVRNLSDNKNTCFDVVYQRVRRQLIEVLKGKYNPDNTFGDTVDLAASICLDAYFTGKYPEYPVMKTKITRKNMADNVRRAFDYFAGRKDQLATNMLQSFGILDGDKIRPEGSMYGAYYIDLLKKLPPQGVLNYSDMFDEKFIHGFVDKRFKIEYLFTPIVFLSLVYGGYAEITMTDGEKITAANLDKVPKIGSMELYQFKYLSRPAQMSMAEFKKMFEVIGLNPILLDNPNDREKACERLCSVAQGLCNSAVLAERTVNDGFELWGEDLVGSVQLAQMRAACSAVKNEFSNYGARFNTPAKLINFTLTMEQVESIGKQIEILMRIPEYGKFKTSCTAIVSYMSGIEYLELGAAMKSEIEQAKMEFRKQRDSIMTGTEGDLAGKAVTATLERNRDKYIDIYFEEHKKKRLGIDDAKRRGKIQESLSLSNLRKLCSIEMLASAKLGEIEHDLAGLVTCYELTPTELKTTPVCPHCHYNLTDTAKNVFGQLDSIEDRIDALLTESTKKLLDMISDPIVLAQKEYLTQKQSEIVDAFIATGKLPVRIDDFFVKSINSLLNGFEPVVIDTDELMGKLDQLPPCDSTTFKAKVNEIIEDYIKGKDTASLRIVVKKRK